VIDDATVVTMAVGTVGVALSASSLDGWVPAALAATGALVLAVRGTHDRPSRRSALVWGAGAVALVCAAVLWRADVDLAGLERPRPEVVEGLAELGGDPESVPYGTRVEVVAGGRRWTAVVPRRHEWVLEGLRMGDRVRLRATTAPLSGAPGGWVRSRHLAGRLQVLRIEPAGGTPVWFAAANAVLDRLGRGADSFSEPHRRLYLGLVVGDDRGQSELTRHRFRVSGLAHLLAVSGQNVAFLLAVLAPLARRCGARVRLAGGLLAVAGFVVLTRAEPSVMRAAMMAGLGLCAAAAGRRAPGIRVVAVAVTCLLVADPMLVHSIGFQLSLAATVAMVLLARPVQRRLPGPEWLALPLSVTLTAQAGALPVMAAHFGTTSVVAVPANLLAEPAAGVVMMAGLTTGLLSGWVRSDVGAVLQLPTRALVWWVDTVARVASQLSVPPLGLWAWASMASCAALAVVLHRQVGPARASVVLVGAALVLCRPPGPTAGQERLAEHATLVERCGSRVLVLGSGSSMAALEALSARGIGRVGVVVGRRDEVPAEVLAQLRAPLRQAMPPACRGDAGAGDGAASSRDPPAGP
jgi:competence protein ComEC